MRHALWRSRGWACVAAAWLPFASVLRADDPAPPSPFAPPPADGGARLEPLPDDALPDTRPPETAGQAPPFPIDAGPPVDAPGFGDAPLPGDVGSPPPADTAIGAGTEPFPPARLPVGGERAADGTMSVLAQPRSAPPPPVAPPFSAAPPAAVPSLPPDRAAPPAAVASPAATLVARAMTLPAAAGSAADPSTTRPLALLEALERSGDRTRRLWITQAYWKLAAAAARYHFAVDAEERLTMVAPGGDAEDLPLLDLAVAAARGDAASAGVELVGAQQELVDLVRLPIVEPAPWPADHPLTAAYQTHFETIFAARPATGRIRAIHRQLPLSHRALQARAEAVTAAEQRFAAMEALHARGKKPIGAVLAAHDKIRDQEEAFVDSVRGYNLAIAEYVMAVADMTVPDERFAAMLIGQPLPWRQPAAPDRVVPVSATGSPPFPPEAQSGLPPRLLQPPAGFAPLPPGGPAGPAGAGVPQGFAPLGG